MDDQEHLSAYLAKRNAWCPQCDYLLRGLTRDTCPECGTKLNLSEIRQKPIERNGVEMHIRGPQRFDTGWYVRAVVFLVLFWGLILGAAGLVGWLWY